MVPAAFSIEQLLTVQISLSITDGAALHPDSSATARMLFLAVTHAPSLYLRLSGSQSCPLSIPRTNLRNFPKQQIVFKQWRFL